MQNNRTSTSGTDAATTNATSHLARLDDLHGFKIADGDPDIGGWEIKTTDGVKVGKVDSLIVDTNALKVRYIDAKLDKHELKLQEERHVLLPIGTARLDDKEDCVMLSTSSSDLSAMSVAGEPTFDREAEKALRKKLDKNYRDDPSGDFYAHPHYDQDSFFGNRRQGREDTTYFTAGDGTTRSTL
jgi:hypothetical protein